MSQVLCGDVVEMLKTIPDESVQCCVTSPPYWGLRDYGHDGQIGIEKTHELYTAKMVEVFREVRRVLRKDGVLFLNLGDSYAGSGKGAWNRDDGQKEVYVPGITGAKIDTDTPGLKPKDLVGIPWRVAFALQSDGWWLRSDIIWSKPNPKPESVADRPTKAHEYIFLLTKSAKYYWDAEAVMEKSGVWNAAKSSFHFDPEQSGQKKAQMVRDGLRTHGGMAHADIDRDTRNMRTVWEISPKPFYGAHFATFPPEIPEKCIKAGSKKGDTVLDPFAGSGTTLEVAKRLGRDYIGIELNPKYVKELIEPRLANINPLFSESA